MLIDRQRQLVGQILALQATRATTMADEVLAVPAANYTSEEHAALERVGWFGGQPSLACLSGDLPQPGAYVTLHIADRPIVVVRALDGGVRAYDNICRHRGAPVARGAGAVARSFSCGFHGWVYDTGDGHLVGQPRSCGGFASLDPGDLGLRPVAAREHHGLVVVDAGRDGGALDVDGWLAGLGDELATYGYGRYVPHRSEVTTWRCNWKLLLDTFFESYHVSFLHRESLGALYTGTASPAEGFGTHNRIVVPMASILGLAEQPEQTWELLPHAVVQYFVAPNVILSHLYGILSAWRFTPLSAGMTEVVQSMYTLAPAASDEERAAYDQRFESARAITSLEDYPESERVARNLASGRLEHTLVGRNEAGVVLFHTAIDRLLEAARGPSGPGPAP